MADRLGAVELLGHAGDHAPLDQVGDAVGDQLGVHAEVAVVAQLLEDGVGDPADADLQRGPVRHPLGDERADAPVRLAHLRRRAARAADSRPPTSRPPG